MDQKQMFENFGKYVLLRKIATGGMAEIFLASRKEATGINQFVVVKRILPHLSVSRKFKKMFKNEGKITSSLRHSNMVSIYEFGCVNDVYYIVMEYISGCSLKDLLNKIRKNKIRLSVPSAINIVRSIASVLHYIHNSIDQETGEALNLIHRDVSPHNVMIGFNGDIKLIDFGIAKNTDHNLTGTGVVKGKFSYMSPEQIRGIQLDYRTDIFSLGSVFWELLTGHKLFNGKNINEIMEKIKRCSVKDANRIRRDIPNRVSSIIHRCLDRDREKRYKSAEILERNLNLLLNKEYPHFSNFDFQTFVKKLYHQEILTERKYFINISKNLLCHPSLDEENWSGTFFDLDLTKISPTDIRAEQSVSDPTTDIKSKQTVRNVKNKPQKEDLTKLSPQAPIHYSKTNVANKNSGNSNIHVDRSALEEFEASRGESLTWTDLIAQSATARIMQRRKRFFMNLFMMVVGVSLVFIAKNYFFDLDVEMNPIADPIFDSPQKTEFDPLPNDLKEAGSKRMLAGVEKKPINQDDVRIFIETQPSGGEIYLNGKKMNKKTPTLIQIPFNSKNKLMIKKAGYKNHFISNLSYSKDIKVRLIKTKN